MSKCSAPFVQAAIVATTGTICVPLPANVNVPGKPSGLDTSIGQTLGGQQISVGLAGVTKARRLEYCPRLGVQALPELSGYRSC
jgi:hypothetical protein